MAQLLRYLQGEPDAGRELLDAVRACVRPLRTVADLDPLIAAIGNAHYVLIGEASHGTSEFYRTRALLTRRLIDEHGFSFVAVEGDWPDCFRINRFVKDEDPSKEGAREALQTFSRWPAWMWANEDVADFVDWLREWNDSRAPANRVGFYGLDVYSLWDSLYSVMGYLRRTDPAALPAAWRAFRCFEPYAEDVQEYSAAARFCPDACEKDVVQLLTELRRSVAAHREDAGDSAFDAEQNAIVLRHAEEYYRTMMRGGPESWNLRNRHMSETLERLMTRHGPQARGIVWAHNTHIGDARFTDMIEAGEFNLGQLTRDLHGKHDVFLLGFASYRGTVIAGRRWESPAEVMTVPPARGGSWDEVIHRTSSADALLLWDRFNPPQKMLAPRGHRAIGVVYRPEYEGHGNYVPTVLPLRYDALIYHDESSALHPLPVPPAPAPAEVPETFPTGA